MRFIFKFVLGYVKENLPLFVFSKIDKIPKTPSNSKGNDKRLMDELGEVKMELIKINKKSVNYKEMIMDSKGSSEKNAKSRNI